MKRLIAITILFACFVVPAGAHESRPAFLELKQISDNGYDLLWKVPARGSNMRLGLYVRFAEDTKVVGPPRTSFVGGAFIERARIARNGGLVGSEIYIEGLSTTLTDVIVRVERLDGTTQVARLTPASPSFIVEATPSVWGVARTYFVLGVQHIWQGADHLLFVACLILIAGTWRRILTTITGFTIAHSITLALAALDVVKVPVPPVEAVIALSILFLATEIARKRRDSLTWRYPITVSASFGLLHGFGFASALGEIGLPQVEIPAALLFFNVGVEAGQIVFVAAVLGSVWGITRLLRGREATSGHWLQVVARPASYCVGTLAMYWTLTRVISFWG